MTRYVIDADVALRLATDRVKVGEGRQLVAPTLIRSELLAALYRSVRRGELTAQQAAERLDFVRGLRLRLLGDRVLQQVAWRVADMLGWEDTYEAEYVAVTMLQADALVTLDDELADAVKGLVEIASVDDLH
ncbi:MAG TPA: type II toxin-antitoxin system VapC family toxin [Marmoricola sp.]|nr:type II toxin-antitoxin system VapC family toxin [Marmoricola sp.]